MDFFYGRDAVKIKTNIESFEGKVLWRKDVEEVAKPVMDWIPCSERLPEKDDEYIVTMGCGFTNLWKYKNKKWELDANVVAWMPLPESYKKESE